MRLCATLLLSLAAGCGATSYGASRDGTFPARAPGASYPNWEHMCVVAGNTSVSDTLNESGEKGWELVTMGPHMGETLMCFKREKPAG